LWRIADDSRFSHGNHSSYAVSGCNLHAAAHANSYSFASNGNTNPIADSHAATQPNTNPNAHANLALHATPWSAAGFLRRN
jgi:hypothetical protein